MPRQFALPERRSRAASPAAFTDAAAEPIDIYGAIGAGPFGDGISAADILGKLRAIKGDTINIRLNSGGGDVYDGIAIYNDLVAHSARVCVTITGVAASAGSLICMAADEIAMTPGSRMMLHCAWCWGEGNAEYFVKLIGELQAVDRCMAEFYAARSGKSVDEVCALMAAETWLSAEEAVAAGFADRIDGGMKTAASARVAQPRNEAARPKFVKRPFAPETVAALEELADRMERVGHARTA